VTGDSGDGWRDALAFLAAAHAGDHEAIGTVLLNASVPALTGSLASVIFGLLAELGADPDGWIADEQARAVAELLP
jgi:hypothetical protein